MDNGRLVRFFPMLAIFGVAVARCSSVAVLFGGSMLDGTDFSVKTFSQYEESGQKFWF